MVCARTTNLANVTNNFSNHIQKNFLYSLNYFLSAFLQNPSTQRIYKLNFWYF